MASPEDGSGSGSEASDGLLGDGSVVTVLKLMMGSKEVGSVVTW